MHVVSFEPQLEVQAIRRFSRAEYDQLVDMGWFVDERLELIRGLLVTMSPHGLRHADTIAYLDHVLTRALGDRALVRAQLPFAAGHDSEPEPDLAVVRCERYRDAHPSSAFLVIEVADTSLARDRAKASLYAAAGVAEYWIVDLNGGIVFVHTDPGPGAATYGSVREHRGRDELHPIAFPDVCVRLADLF